jgi:hypothetical protein
MSLGIGVAWRERYACKTKASSLGKHITAADTALFARGMAMKDLVPIPARADHSFAEIVTESRLGLAVIDSSEQWALPVIIGIKRQTQRIEDAGGRLALTWLANKEDVEGYRVAKLRGATSRRATIQGDAIGLAVVHEAGNQGELEAKSQDRQADRRRKEVVYSSVPAAQVWTCGHRNPPAQDRQDPKCTMLVVQREQSNSRSPPAEMSEVGKAARLNAVRAECEKGLDQCKAGPSRPEDSIWKRGRRRSTSVHKKHRNGQVAG